MAPSAMGNLHQGKPQDHAPAQAKVRVGVVHIVVPRGFKAWPCVDFDYPTRLAEIEADLAAGCPGLAFESLTVEASPQTEIPRVRKLADRVDGLLVFVLATNWPLTIELLPEIGSWALSTVFVDEPYAGSGVFLCHGAKALRENNDVIMLSSTRFQDVLDVVNCFAELGRPDGSHQAFLAAAEKARSGNLCSQCAGGPCKDDPIHVQSVEHVLDRLKHSKILRVVSDWLPVEVRHGVTIESVTFDEINSAYHAVDRQQAKSWANRWMAEAADIREPSPKDVEDAAAIYLAMKQLMEGRGARGITVDCLGGFYSGKLPGYPCLGYRQLNDDGVLLGTCEARVPDMLSMLIFRDMFNRNSFASDPVIDTSTGQIIYAHCVAPTKMLGPDSKPNAFFLRSHAEDNLGASIQSIMPEGYMTTSIGWDDELTTMVLHQARAVGNVDEDRACRTKLAAEVEGDMDRLLREWDRFNWHRVTVYGDVREPLEQLAQALGVAVVLEA